MKFLAYVCECAPVLGASRIQDGDRVQIHRYRRPRLLTPSLRRANFENPRWRLNRSKTLGIIKGKPCFSQFTSPQCFRSRSITIFWEDIFVAEIKNKI